MKILLDENIDVRFKYALDLNAHQVFTVKDMQWAGISNGQLLKLMEAHKFDVWIAVDKNLPYQQNTAALPVTIIILDIKRNVLSSLHTLISQLEKRLSQTLEKEIIILRNPPFP